MCITMEVHIVHNTMYVWGKDGGRGEVEMGRKKKGRKERGGRSGGRRRGRERGRGRGREEREGVAGNLMAV